MTLSDNFCVRSRATRTLTGNSTALSGNFYPLWNCGRGLRPGSLGTRPLVSG